MPVSFMLIKKTFFNSFIPAITWWIIVLGLMCTPGKDFPELGSWTDLIKLDKLIHIGVFGLMVYLFCRPISQRDISLVNKKQTFARIAIACSIWGLTIEFIQHFWIPGRSMDLYDFVADSLGCYLAYLYSKRYLLR
jgi:VanZ family protein